jgi:hypothetical protein
MDKQRRELNDLRRWQQSAEAMLEQRDIEIGILAAEIKSLKQEQLERTELQCDLRQRIEDLENKIGLLSLENNRLKLLQMRRDTSPSMAGSTSLADSKATFDTGTMSYLMKFVVIGGRNIMRLNWTSRRLNSTLITSVLLNSRSRPNSLDNIN